MKRLLFLLIAASVLTAMRVATQELPIGSNIPSPTLKMKDADGQVFSFADVKRKNGLLVVFSCNTCPWVIKNQQVAQEALQYAQSKQVGVIVLNSNAAQRTGDDAPEAMKAYASKQNYQWPYVMDEESAMANAFGAKVTPECYLFDANLKLVYHGAVTDNPKTPDQSDRYHLKIAIDELISGKPISVTTSKAMGCTIKRKS